MKVVVLGSSGQIGAYLTEYLRKKGHFVREFDVVNDPHEDMTHIPNPFLRNVIMDSDFVFFLAFDVGGSHYLKKYQHTFKFLDNNTRMMANVFGIEKDMEKAHVITDFIRKGFETGVIDMMTDGTEKREFLYAEDCCEALETIMGCYDQFTSDDELHITTGISTSILEIAQNIQTLFKGIGKEVKIVPSSSKDEVQKDARNIPDSYIKKWWQPKTTLRSGIKKVFEVMKNDWV